MDQLFAALDASWRVLLVGLVLGAGLPTVYAFGIRALAWGTGGDAQLSNAGEPACLLSYLKWREHQQTHLTAKVNTTI